MSGGEIRNLSGTAGYVYQLVSKQTFEAGFLIRKEISPRSRGAALVEMTENTVCQA